MKSINRQILAITLPAIVTNITTPLLGLIDVAIVGHIGNAFYIGAIAVGGNVFNMLYWLFGFLRLSSSGLTAQAFGADDKQRISVVLFRALLVAAVVAFTILVFQHQIGQAVLGFLTDDDSTCRLATRYYEIAVWGAPAVLGNYAVCGWLIGMQNTRHTMWIAIVTNITNIAASLVLVLVLGMKIEGVATGTLIAQWAGFLTGIIIVATKYAPRRPSLRTIANRSQLVRFFRLNADLMLRTVCLIAVTLWFTRAGAEISPIVLAANSLLMQLFLLYSYFVDGFAYAGEALAGKYYGMGSFNKLNEAVRMLLRWASGMAILFTFIYLAAGKPILHMLTNDVSVISTATRYLPWIVAVPAAGFLAFVWDGIFVGLTLTRKLFSSIALASALFFGIYFILAHSMGNHGLWIAFVVYLLTRGLVQWRQYAVFMRKNQTKIVI